MSRPRRPDVDPLAVLARLAPGLRAPQVTELGEGWDNVAYAVDGRLLLRVSKHADPRARAEEVERDAGLLQFAGRHSSLATNEVLASDPQAGALLLTLVAGETADVQPPTDGRSFAASMAAFLTRLHSAPAVEAAAVAQVDQTLESWFAETVAGWEGVRSAVPVDDRLAVDDFLVLERPVTPRRVTFCHNDLGDEHIVMGAGGAEVAGVIDWSDAILGDPARDLALLWLDFGTVVVDNVLAGYQGPVEGDLRARSWWYAAHAGVEGLTYRTRHLPHTVDEAIRRLRHVLAEGAA